MNAPVKPPAGNGAGRKRRPAKTPKGRQVDPAALDAVRALLGDKPRRRDLLIEHLHLIQDRYGHLSAAHLAALAQEMKLAQTEVYEVATFYAHFDVVKEGEAPPPPVTVRVCDSLSCAMAGAEKLLNDLPEKLGPGVRVVRAPCMGACDRAPVCAVGHVQVMKADGESVSVAASKSAHAHAHKPEIDFAAYRAAGGYTLLGRYDKAMQWLTTAVERGFINYPFLNAHDPLLADLRSRPAFTRLMDDVRRRWNAFPA